MAKPHAFDALVDRLAEAIAQRLGPRLRRAPKRKPNFSKAGIERIRAAAKKRWAKWRKAKRG